jgi:hypothetical protein
VLDALLLLLPQCTSHTGHNKGGNCGTLGVTECSIIYREKRNWSRCGKKQSWFNLRDYPTFSWGVGLKKINNIFVRMTGYWIKFES